jgi:hypothetical protein
MTNNRSLLLLLWVWILLLLPRPGHAVSAVSLQAPSATAPQSTPDPGLDRLREPSLPETPTEVDVGRSLYYFHCMPCHGDRGQGLTDEWREVWVEDHQNCWARGCHTGKSDLSAFYIPHYVPALSGSSAALASFSSPQELFEFIYYTQPPQRPGALTEEEYWSLTAFLLAESGQEWVRAEVEPVQAGPPEPRTDVILVGILSVCLVMVLLPHAGGRHRPTVA